MDLREIFEGWINKRGYSRNCITESYTAYTILNTLSLPGEVIVYESQFTYDYPSGPYHWFVGYTERGKPTIYVDGHNGKITTNVTDLGVHPDSVKPTDFDDMIKQYTPKALMRRLNRVTRREILSGLMNNREFLDELGRAV